RSALFPGTVWLYLHCEIIKHELIDLKQKYGHRIASIFSLVVYTVDVGLDIYTVYKLYHTLHEKVNLLLTSIGVAFIIISSVVGSSISLHLMRRSWSDDPSSFKWYHKLLYNPVGFLLLPLCILAANAKRAWSSDRKEFEAKEANDVKYVIITESLIEGLLQLMMQVHILIKVEPLFTLA
ncbi:unnamed protein product, partial [Meganyctiphanes norvegica]